MYRNFYKNFFLSLLLCSTSCNIPILGTQNITDFTNTTQNIGTNACKLGFAMVSLPIIGIGTFFLARALYYTHKADKALALRTATKHPYVVQNETRCKTALKQNTDTCNAATNALYRTNLPNDLIDTKIIHKYADQSKTIKRKAVGNEIKYYVKLSNNYKKAQAQVTRVEQEVASIPQSYPRYHRFSTIACTTGIVIFKAGLLIKGASYVIQGTNFLVSKATTKDIV